MIELMFFKCYWGACAVLCCFFFCKVLTFLQFVRAMPLLCHVVRLRVMPLLTCLCRLRVMPLLYRVVPFASHAAAASCCAVYEPCRYCVLPLLCSAAYDNDDTFMPIFVYLALLVCIRLALLLFKCKSIYTISHAHTHITHHLCT